MTRHFTPLLLLVLVGLTATGSPQRRQQKQSQPKATSSIQKTGPSLPLSSTPEQEIVDEINLARSNPLQYSRYLADFKRQYTGNQIRFSDGSVLITNEGVAAVDEAIEFLRLAKPEASFEMRAGLGMAARTHLEDLMRTGRTGHKGSDGSNAEDRFSRFGTWSDSVGENIIYHSRSARENVISLLIDDGVKNRGHRKNIFKSSFRAIGVAFGTPPKSTNMCIITFAGGYIDKPLPNTKGSAPSARKL
jgi:uncharacterized protein YkwD